MLFIVNCTPFGASDARQDEFFGLPQLAGVGFLAEKV